MLVYLLWLIMVISWNYGAPDAAPMEDVGMAIIISFIAYTVKKFL